MKLLRNERVLAALVTSLCLDSQPLQARPLAIVGVTIVGLGGVPDRANMTVVINHGRIVSIYNGSANRTLRRAGRLIDGRNRYLVPGLIDTFGAMRSQAYADAYLYEGVTTVVVARASADSILGGEQTILKPPNGPAVLTGRWISGYNSNGNITATSPWLKDRQAADRLTTEVLRALVRRAAASGDKVINAAPDLWPGQLRVIVDEAHRQHLSVFAEPAFTTYPEAAAARVDAFVRNDRYSLWTAGDKAFAAFAADPFGGGGKAAVKIICDGQSTSAAKEFGKTLRAGPFLIPTLSMEATADGVGAPNPWHLRSAKFFSPADLDDPADPATGEPPFLKGKGASVDRIRGCARAKQQIDRELHAAGARYVAGSSAPGYGVLPGGGLHVELGLLQFIGLSPRQALEAATIRAAVALRLRDRGLVAVGRRADLVILRSNPVRGVDALSDIVNVYVNGHRVNRERVLRAP